MLFENGNLKKGKLMSTTKGYGFVDIDGNGSNIYFIPQDITYWNWSGRNMLYNGIRGI